MSVAYSLNLHVSGGTSPFNWTVTTGTLPAGLALNSSGQISGTPTTAGTSNITIQVTDFNGAVVSKAFSLKIDPPLVITTSSPVPRERWELITRRPLRPPVEVDNISGA